MDDMHGLLKSYAANSFFLFDEVHYMFGDSKRSSVALELAKTCNLFVAMSGTLVRNKDIARDNIIEWLGQVVDFEINAENYMIGVASLIAFKKELPIKQNRVEVEVPVLDDAYYDYVDASFGGRSSVVNYHKAATICFESVYYGIVERVKEHRRQNHGCIFVVAKDKSMQQRLYDELSSLGFKCFAVSSGNSISITSASNPHNIEVVIATPKQETGYDVTAAKYMITAPYPSNEASRTQLVGRIVRLSQESPEVFIEIVHCGILTYSMRYHEIARMIAKSLSGMQRDI
jgi:superfamily II DNA or RNA helicase